MTKKIPAQLQKEINELIFIEILRTSLESSIEIDKILMTNNTST